MSLSIRLEGGLGNKLFQLAFLHSLSRKNPHLKCYYNILNYYKTSHETVDWSYFTKTFQTFKQNMTTNFAFREEKFRPCRYVNYNPAINELFTQFPNTHIDFFGYFQSEKYFDEFRMEILEKFRVTPESKKYLTEKYADLDNSIFLHIRRGDNCRPDCINLSSEYYSRALNTLASHLSNVKTRVYLCSDDIDWCKKQNLYQDSDKFTFVFVSEDEINTLWLMSLCKLGGICANSTFSWWGGYLNENNNAKILFPNKIAYFWDIEDHIPKNFTSFDIGDVEKHKYIS